MHLSGFLYNREYKDRRLKSEMKTCMDPCACACVFWGELVCVLGCLHVYVCPNVCLHVQIRVFACGRNFTSDVKLESMPVPTCVYLSACASAVVWVCVVRRPVYVCVVCVLGPNPAEVGTNLTMFSLCACAWTCECMVVCVYVCSIFASSFKHVCSSIPIEDPVRYRAC